ncbi:hexose transporter protein [Aspergillus steynii IBT 23096]|uniref:Hexose transporter protein n=1 Tax=Aspergillus steynii IBT 23096 TaxID=1392250 RepID=A0A2I2GPH8_9EURO|nr:hexose transporter protein [Aspergillus steynii IBT 23096]PLB54785.1 hexose transporter protein [Aspergillus steynii IBT 23096]
MGSATFELAGRQFPRVTWWKNPGMRKTYICLMFVVLTSATNGYDGSMMNGLQTLDYWQEYFNHPSGSLLGILSAIMSLGSLAALPVVPYAADLLGRRMGVLIGCTIMILGVVLQSISANYGMFLAARFLIGFGVAIAHGASPLLITELVHTQHRAVFTTIYNTTWYLGSIVAAWLTFGTNNIKSDWAWRAPTVVQAVPSVLQIIFIWFVPESPRFLIYKGKNEQALKVLADCHANGDQMDEVVQLEMHEIQETIRLEKEYESSNWMELIRTKGNRHRMIICISAGLFSQWSGNGLVSYYIAKILESIGYTSSVQQNLINGCLQIMNFIVALTMCFFVDKIGRRKLFLISTAGMLVAFIVWTICSARYDISHTSGTANAVIAMIYVYYLFYNVAWSGLLVGYTVEILPYSIRAKGMTVMWFCIDAALFFNQYINPIALDNIGWKYYIFYCVWLGFELVVVWFFYIETRNTPLEEIAKYFDGDNAMVGGVAGTQKAKELATTLSVEETVTSTEKVSVVNEKPPPKQTRAAKQALIVAHLQSTQTCHTLKELEKSLPAVASVHAMQVKEHLQELADEGRIRVEKIGSGNWYWSFAGDERREKERVRSELLSEVGRARAACEKTEGKLAARRLQMEREREDYDQGDQGREQGEKMGDEKGEEKGEEVEAVRNALMKQKAALEAECRRVRGQAKAQADRGKSVPEMKAETERFRAAAQMWTDNVFVLEAYVRRLAGGDREILTALQQECYGGEYVDGEGLRELPED